MLAEILGWKPDSTDLAVLSLLVALAATVINPWVTWLVARRAQRHERELSHDQRLYERRAEAYVALLTDTERFLAWISRTEPLLGPMAAPPELLNEEGEFALHAQVLAYASPKVLAAQKTLAGLNNSFHGHLLTARMLRQQQADATQSMTALHDAKVATRDAAEVLAEQVRTELTSLPR